MSVYLRAKFEVSRIIVMSFRHDVGNFTLPPPQNEPLKNLPRLGLSTYATGRGTKCHPKWLRLRTGGGDATLFVYLRTYTISFRVFGSIFVLQCLILFVEI